jgi:hypothetical protein
MRGKNPDSFTNKPTLEGLAMRVFVTAVFVTGAIIAAAANFVGPAWSQSAPVPPVQDASVKPIGKIVKIQGAVAVQHVNAVVVQATLGNQSGEAKLGDLIYLGDIIRTGADGNVGISFTDGTAFNLSSNARMEMTEFVYDPNGKSNSTLLSLTKGTFTFVAGKIAKTGDMKIDTPVATMGIRGTTPHVEISDDGTVKFSTLTEEGKNEVMQKYGAASIKPRGGAAPDRIEAIERKKLNLEICRGC